VNSTLFPSKAGKMVAQEDQNNAERGKGRSRLSPVTCLATVRRQILSCYWLFWEVLLTYLDYGQAGRPQLLIQLRHILRH